MKGRLERADRVTLTNWKALGLLEGWEITRGLYWTHGGRANLGVIKAGGAPLLLSSEWTLRECEVLEQPKEDDAARLIWGKTMKGEAFRGRHAAHWNETGEEDGTPVDVILCPVEPGVAPVLSHSKYWCCTSIWNLSNYPAMVFPSGKVDQEKDEVEQRREVMSKANAWNYEQYVPKKYIDAPISLQLVGRRWGDEKVFEAMEFFRKSCGGVGGICFGKPGSAMYLSSAYEISSLFS